MYAQLFLLIVLGIPIAISDIRTRRIPNNLLLILILGSEVFRVIFDRPHFWISLQVGLVSAVACGALHGGFRGRIGMGDLKLMVVLAIILADFHRAVFGLLFALLAAGIFSLMRRRKSVAFAPALICAALLTL